MHVSVLHSRIAHTDCSYNVADGLAPQRCIDWAVLVDILAHRLQLSFSARSNYLAADWQMIRDWILDHRHQCLTACGCSHPQFRQALGHQS